MGLTRTFGWMVVGVSLLLGSIAGAGENPGDGAAAADEWRSTLYPEDWQPGYTNERGHFLHDFSYAGYRMGEKPIPEDVPGSVVDVTEPPYDADPTGEADSTDSIQRAIDHVGEQGGGVVYLPEGTYQVRPPEGAWQSLVIGDSGVVLRGDGPGKTKLFNAEPVMRRKSVIAVRPEAGQTRQTGSPDGRDWYQPLEGSAIAFAADAANQATRIRLERVNGLDVGDWVALRHDLTRAFLEESAPGEVDRWHGRLPGLVFYRQITGVDRDAKAVTIDIPLRHGLRTRDNARATRLAPHLEEVGLEHLAIGMREHPGDRFGASAYNKRDTAAYDVHGAYLVTLNHVVHAWIRNVHTYRPPVNNTPHHILSNGIRLTYSRNVTVQGCDIRQAQYRGRGGNGYGYIFQGSDNLIQDCHGQELRYVYDFKSMQSTGNVVHRSTSHGTNDFHMHLSVANLLDNLHMTHGYFNAVYRGNAGTVGHGRTTDQSVFWNLRNTGRRDKLLRVDGQPDAFFIIGTSGNGSAVRGLGEEHAHRLEGHGRGEALVPESLYQDQLRRRLQRAGQAD